jgi:hypothetical protein
LSEQDEDDAEPSGEADPKVRPGKRRSRKVETSTGDPRQKLRKEITSAAISERETGTRKRSRKALQTGTRSGDEGTARGLT